MSAIRAPVVAQVRAPWRSFVTIVGALDFVLLAVAAAALTDPEAALIAVGMIVGIFLLRFRKGLLGFIVLVLLFADVAVWMLPGALSNLSHNEGFVDTALPGALAIFSITGLIGVVGYWIGLDQRVGRAVAALALVALGALVVVSLGSPEEAVARPGEISLDMKDVKFSGCRGAAPCSGCRGAAPCKGDENIEADAGNVHVLVSNHDLFWHTFTIKELDVNLRVPVGGERRVSFDAAAGTYEFVCAIPGHTQAGMKGTLTVR